MKTFIIISILLTAALADDQPSFPAFTTHQREIVNPDSVDDFVFNGNVTKPPSSRPVIKISNGRQARDGQFPFVAEISINLQSGGLLCTGSLIAKNWILSARHCIADTNAKSVLASLGSADRQNPTVRIYSNMFIWLNAGDGHHPDIALFRLAQNAPNNNRVKPIALPSRGRQNSLFEGNVGTAIGFGGTGGGQLPRYLQYTQFRVLNRNQCYLGENILCSQPQSGTSSLQGGDSGGPFVDTVDGTLTLIGVNVFVATSGSNVWQGSTRVAGFLSFIHDSTGIPYR
ncbi:unnamed protein product [Chironomus riparius]|uniref:Peptidase S1 domain-containing protein n=1 Tax=Chironomus riparius TaxID=315576 RepID=A0A9N9X0D9_9DIPT|nr:unnamed protein product [Chironomus riparius]